MVNKGNLTRWSNIHNSRLQLSKDGSDNIPLMLIHWVVIYPLNGAIHHLKTLFEPLPLELLSRSSNVGAARKESGAPNDNIVQKHLNIALLNVF